MAITQEQIDDVILDARSGELEELKAFFTEHGVSVLPQIKDEYSLSTALHMASANGHLDVVNYLLELAKENDEILKQIIDAKNESGNTPLHWASLNGHLDVVKVLCDAGAQPFITNEANHDAFYEAEANGKEDVIDYLLGRYSVEPVNEDESEEPTDESSSSTTTAADASLVEKVNDLDVNEK